MPKQLTQDFRRVDLKPTFLHLDCLNINLPILLLCWKGIQSISQEQLVCKQMQSQLLSQYQLTCLYQSRFLPPSKPFSSLLAAASHLLRPIRYSSSLYVSLEVGHSHCKEKAYTAKPITPNLPMEMQLKYYPPKQTKS